MSDSVRPHRWQPTRLPCPWDSPGKNTGVGCHFLLQCMKEKSESEVAQSCPTLSDPLDCSLPGSSIHGIFQARVLEWSAIAFSTLNPIVIYFILFFWKHLPIWTTSWKVLLAGTCRNLSGLTFTIFSSPSQPFWYLCNAENTKLREKGYQWPGRDFLDFSGGPVAENPCSQCKGPGFNSWSGN